MSSRTKLARRDDPSDLAQQVTATDLLIDHIVRLLDSPFTNFSVLYCRPKNLFSLHQFGDHCTIS